MALVALAENTAPHGGLMDPSLFATVRGPPSSLNADLLALAQGQRAAAEQFERLQRHLRAFQQAHGLPPSPNSTGIPVVPIDPRMFQGPERVNSARQGHHSFIIGGTRFDIPERYTPLKLLGQGAYGIVIAARDNLSGDNVAIKKIPNAFANLTDTKRTLREIRLLRHLQHENVISLRDIFRPPSKLEFDDLYLVNELMDTDLHQIIASPNVLTDEHCQYFLYQVLRGLKYIHSANVLHRDLKPSNLLLNKDCLLKIADFGLARVEDDQEGFMTEYVATRWYRAPEVILSWKEYTKAIDVWSVGCLFAELLFRRPFFQGKDYIHQVMRITEVLGTPGEDDIECIANEQARRYIRSLGQRPPIPLERILPNANPLAIDLLRRMLTFNPRKRCTVEEALSHPYLEGLHDPECEPVAASHFVFDFEKFPLNKQVFQELIWQEMIHFHPEAAGELQSAHAAHAAQAVRSVSVTCCVARAVLCSRVCGLVIL